MADPAQFSNLPTPDQIAYNRKLSERLMLQGQSAEPVGHWTQGLARVLQGGMGGYHKSQADTQQQERSSGMMTALQGSDVMKGLGPADAAVLGSSPEMMQAAYTKSLARKLDPYGHLPNSVQEYKFGQTDPGFAEHLKKKKLAEQDFGKTGAIFQGPDQKFYTIQFGSRGEKIIEPVQVGGVPLTPAKGITMVGDEALNSATGGTIRNVAPQIAGGEFAKGQGDTRAKFYASAPKLVMAQASLERQHDVIKDEVSRVLPEVDKWGGSGVFNAMSRNVWGTPAFKVAELVKTIRANIGFDKLQEIRENSPTGSGLGNTTERELSELQAVLGSLETAQQASDVKYNLKRLSKILDSSSGMRRQFLEMEMQRHQIDASGIPIQGSQKNQARMPPRASPIVVDSAPAQVVGGGRPQPQPSPQQQPQPEQQPPPMLKPLAMPKTPEERDRLPSGTKYLDPNGYERTRP